MPPNSSHATQLHSSTGVLPHPHPNCRCLLVGTRSVCGVAYLVLEDLAAGYSRPAVLDAKLGLRTWYPWGPQALIDKYRSAFGEGACLVGRGTRAADGCGSDEVAWFCSAFERRSLPAGGPAPVPLIVRPPLPPARLKDESTTQATLGFRLCGVKAPRLDGSVWTADRHWGKGLDRAGAADALRRFTENGWRPAGAWRAPCT